MSLASFKMHQRKDKLIQFIGYCNDITSEETIELLNIFFKNDIDILAYIQKISKNNIVEKSQYTSELTNEYKS